MKRTFVGHCYNMQQINNIFGTRERLIQHAIGEVMFEAGARLRRDATRNGETPFVPAKIEIDILERGWDLQVRIRMEDADKQRATVERDQGELSR